MPFQLICRERVIFYQFYLYLCAYAGVQHDCRFSSCCLTVTRGLSLVEQYMPNNPGVPEFILWLDDVRVAKSFILAMSLGPLFLLHFISFDQCIAWSFWNYGCLLSLRYLHAFLTKDVPDRVYSFQLISW